MLIHVRFHPSSEVNTIDYCPEHMGRQDWYYLLRYAAPQQYQAFAGGRGFFRIPRRHFDTIVSAHAASA